jgi:hypothetical protein
MHMEVIEPGVKQRPALREHLFMNMIMCFQLIISLKSCNSSCTHQYPINGGVLNSDGSQHHCYRGSSVRLSVNMSNTPVSQKVLDSTGIVLSPSHRTCPQQSGNKAHLAAAFCVDLGVRRHPWPNMVWG